MATNADNMKESNWSSEGAVDLGEGKTVQTAMDATGAKGENPLSEYIGGGTCIGTAGRIDKALGK